MLILALYPNLLNVSNFIKKDVKVLEFYNNLKKDTNIPVGLGDMLASLYDEYLFSPDANIEKFLSVLEGVDLYIADIEFRNTVEEQRNYIRKLIRDRLNNSNEDTVINNYISFYNGLKKVKEVNGLKNQIFNIFTTNYDMMNEMAMESQNI